jgi:hypothetical protein
MQRLKNILLRNSGAITLGLGVCNISIWTLLDPAIYFLVTGLILCAVGQIQILSEGFDEAQ